MPRLLDKTVEDRRATQQAAAAAGLGDVHSPDNSWVISPVEDLRFNLRPVRAQGASQSPHLHAVDFGGPLVGFHGLQGFERVASREHAFDEVCWFGSR